MKNDSLRDLVLHQDLLRSVETGRQALTALNNKRRHLTSVIFLYDAVFAGCMLLHGSMLGYLIQAGPLPVLTFVVNCALISVVLWKALVARNQRLEVDGYIGKLSAVVDEGQSHIDSVGVQAAELERQIDHQMKLDVQRFANWS